MDDLIPISNLNDFIFCPASIYFHKLYGSRDTMLYQKKPQLDGTKAHETIDCGRYCSGKNVLTGLDVYSAKYGLIGKIDIYDRNKAKLIERKKRIKTIYDGYILQLYGQYFAMTEMGYQVKQLGFYSMDDNRSYSVPLPEENEEMFELFETVVERLRTMDIMDYRQENGEKCRNCIYFDACDRGIL